MKWFQETSQLMMMGIHSAPQRVKLLFLPSGALDSFSGHQHRVSFHCPCLWQRHRPGNQFNLFPHKLPQHLDPLAGRADGTDGWMGHYGWWYYIDRCATLTDDWICGGGGGRMESRICIGRRVLLWFVSDRMHSWQSMSWCDGGECLSVLSKGRMHVPMR